PGETDSFSGAVTAPSVPGIYNFSWMMGHQGGPDWTFGSACNQQMTVGAGSQVAAPLLSPPGGAYTSAQSVTLTSATPGATIRYTTDTTAPSEIHGTVYVTGTPVPVAASTTIKAIAYATGFLDSSVSVGQYTFSTGTGGGSGGSGPPNGSPGGDSGNGLDPRR